MRKLLLLLVLILFYTSTSYADVYTEKTKVKNALTRFSLFLFENPATKRYLYKESFWEINSIYKYNRQKSLVQNGDKSSICIFNTHNYLIQTDKLYYGDLQYSTGRRENQLWSETSDYNTVYPYVIADAQGGDINFEEYFFHGGYSKQFKSFSIGFEAYYKAKNEYRTLDPRPRNIVSEYGLKMGLSLDIYNYKVLGLDFSYENYKQENDIEIFKKGVMQKFYIMKGFGYYDITFSKVFSKFRVNYDIHSFGSSVQFFSKDNEGLFASLSVKQSILDQRLASFNNVNSLDLNTSSIGIDIAYSLNENLYAKFYSSIFNRNGYENVYETLVSNHYHYITKYSNYSSSESVIGNSYLILFDNKEQNINIDIAYKESKQEYLSTKSFQEISNIKAMISYTINKRSFSTELYLAYLKNISADIQLSDKMIVPNIKEEMLLPNFEYLSSSRVFAGIVSDYNYELSSDKDLFVRSDLKLEKMRERDLFLNYIFTLGIRF